MAFDAPAARIDVRHLARFLAFVGMPVDAAHAGVPLCYLHVFSQRALLSLLAHPRFPLPVLGLVHRSVSFVQHVPVGVDVSLRITTLLLDEQAIRGGRSFSVKTQIRAEETLAVEIVNTFLAREPGAGQDGPKPGMHELRALRAAESAATAAACDVAASGIRFSSRSARRYALVSGDFNPVHLGHWTARRFGLRQAIAHGMHAAAVMLAHAWALDSRRVAKATIQFERALYLPCEATLWHGMLGEELQLMLAVKRKLPNVTGLVSYATAGGAPREST